MYQECSKHSDWAIPTKQHHKLINPRVKATSTKKISCLLKSTWKIPVLGQLKQPALAAAESKPALTA